MTKKVLVTGGAGFIGSHLVEACLEQGWDVTVLDSLVVGKREYVPPAVTFIKADIRGKGLLPAGRFDFVFHLAAEPFIPKSFDNQRLFVDVNVMGTLNILEASRRWRAERVLVVSSSEVYGTAQQTPMREDHPLNPQSTYAATKLAAESLAVTMFHECKVPAIVMRPFNTFGPRILQPYVIPEIISQAFRGNTISLGNADSVRDFSYVKNTARAMIDLLIRGEPGDIYNYGSGVTCTIRGVVDAVAKRIGKDLTITLDEKKLRPNDVTWLEADNTKILPLLSFKDCINGPAGLAETIDWFRQNGCRWPWEA